MTQPGAHPAVGSDERTVRARPCAAVSATYLLVPEDEIIQLSMTVGEAFELVMSGGIVTPERPGT